MSKIRYFVRMSEPFPDWLAPKDGEIRRKTEIGPVAMDANRGRFLSFFKKAKSALKAYFAC